MKTHGKMLKTSLLMKVLTPEQIAQGCGLSLEEVLEIEKGIK